MATFNRFDYGSHITYQVVDTGNTIVNLTPDEAYSLLDWLYRDRIQVYQDVHAHDPESLPTLIEAYDEMSKDADKGDPASHQHTDGDDKTGKPRGLAAMTPERRREIAHMGGEALKASGNRRVWTHEEAVENGHRGGKRSKRGAAKKHRSGDEETMTGSA